MRFRPPTPPDFVAEIRRFFAGFEFNIHAGGSVVGNGFITEVTNERLAKGSD